MAAALRPSTESDDPANLCSVVVDQNTTIFQLGLHFDFQGLDLIML